MKINKADKFMHQLGIPTIEEGHSAASGTTPRKLAPRQGQPDIARKYEGQITELDWNSGVPALTLWLLPRSLSMLPRSPFIPCALKLGSVRLFTCKPGVTPPLQTHKGPNRGPAQAMGTLTSGSSPLATGS